MVRLKNVRSGILIIADAGLKLAPGEDREISELTPQAKQALDNGFLAQMDRDKETKPASKAADKVPETKSQSKSSSRKTEEKGSGKSEAIKSESTEPAASKSTDNAGGSGDHSDSTQRSLIEAESGDN
ncbi:hypothetical protein LLG46_03610 [bacterium]|nr:hypothetical protein [bacterium]